VDCDDNKEGNSDGHKGGRGAKVMAMKREMAKATRVLGDKEGTGNGSKRNGGSNEGGG
jgi:hypothetical protein